MGIISTVNNLMAMDLVLLKTTGDQIIGGQIIGDQTILVHLVGGPIILPLINGTLINGTQVSLTKGPSSTKCRGAEIVLPIVCSGIMAGPILDAIIMVGVTSPCLGVQHRGIIAVLIKCRGVVQIGRATLPVVRLWVVRLGAVRRGLALDLAVLRLVAHLLVVLDLEARRLEIQ